MLCKECGSRGWHIISKLSYYYAWKISTSIELSQLLDWVVRGGSIYRVQTLFCPEIQGRKNSVIGRANRVKWSIILFMSEDGTNTHWQYFGPDQSTVNICKVTSDSGGWHNQRTRLEDFGMTIVTDLNLINHWYSALAPKSWIHYFAICL